MASTKKSRSRLFFVLLSAVARLFFKAAPVDKSRKHDGKDDEENYDIIQQGVSFFAKAFSTSPAHASAIYALPLLARRSDTRTYMHRGDRRRRCGDHVRRNIALEIDASARHASAPRSVVTRAYASKRSPASSRRTCAKEHRPRDRWIRNSCVSARIGRYPRVFIGAIAGVVAGVHVRRNIALEVIASAPHAPAPGSVGVWLAPRMLPDGLRAQRVRRSCEDQPGAVRRSHAAVLTYVNPRIHRFQTHLLTLSDVPRISSSAKEPPSTSPVADAFTAVPDFPPRRGRLVSQRISILPAAVLKHLRLARPACRR